MLYYKSLKFKNKIDYIFSKDNFYFNFVFLFVCLFVCFSFATIILFCMYSCSCIGNDATRAAPILGQFHIPGRINDNDHTLS